MVALTKTTEKLALLTFPHTAGIGQETRKCHKLMEITRRNDDSETKYYSVRVNSNLALITNYFSVSKTIRILFPFISNPT